VCPPDETKKAVREAARTLEGARGSPPGPDLQPVLFYFKPRSYGAFCLPPKRRDPPRRVFQEWSATALKVWGFSLAQGRDASVTGRRAAYFLTSFLNELPESHRRRNTPVVGPRFKGRIELLPGGRVKLPVTRKDLVRRPACDFYSRRAAVDHVGDQVANS